MMKNSIVKYDQIEVDDYILNDYTSRSLTDIYTLPEITNAGFIEYYQLADNETLESVAYKLYGSTQYWDVLLMINIADPLFDMVYDFDNVSDIAAKFINEYNFEIYINPSLPLDYVTELTDSKIQELETLKEERRPLKTIRPGKLLDFMKILRQQEII